MFSIYLVVVVVIHLTEIPTRFPFETDTLIGYSVACTMEYLFSVLGMITVKCFFMVGIATMPMLFALTDDIKLDLNAIQRSLTDKRTRSKMAKPLTQFIQFHSDTKQFEC